MRPPYPWQQASWQTLLDAQGAGRMSQSVLITGQAGVGKHLFARELAKTGLCERRGEQACNTCANCHQFEAGAHPDFIEIAVLEDKREILIDQIREFCRQIQFTPSQARGRFAVIHAADRLTLAAANALLKTLEEPPRNAVLLLTGTQLSKIPGTIRSRCTRVHIPTPTPAQASAWLQARFPDHSAPLQWVLRSQGPCNLHVADDLVNQHQNKFSAWADMLQRLQRSRDPLAAAARVDDADFEDFLRWWQEELLAGMRAGQIGMEQRRLWDALLRVRRQSSSNFNRLLALEGLFILYLTLQPAS